MASIPAPASPAAGERRDLEVPLWRLYLIRALCLFFVAQAFTSFLPHLVDHASTERGMLTSILAGLWVLAFVAFRYPMQMLPILLFEFVWKTIWLIFYGLPQWIAGIRTPQLQEDIWAIGLGPFVFGLFIPWGYVWRHYVLEPSERWR